MIFNRSLSQSEILALYNSQANLFNATFTNLTNAQHNYTVYAIDQSGNTNNSGQRNFVVSNASNSTNLNIADNKSYNSKSNKCFQWTGYINKF